MLVEQRRGIGRRQHVGHGQGQGRGAPLLGVELVQPLGQRRGGHAVLHRVAEQGQAGGVAVRLDHGAQGQLTCGPRLAQAQVGVELAAPQGLGVHHAVGGGERVERQRGLGVVEPVGQVAA